MPVCEHTTWMQQTRGYTATYTVSRLVDVAGHLYTYKQLEMVKLMSLQQVCKSYTHNILITAHVQGIAYTCT